MYPILKKMILTEPLIDREGASEQRFRSEWKYLISYPEAEQLKKRLAVYMERDPYAAGGEYLIRSLYFDDCWNSAYEEKMMGIRNRQKWRIRIYDYQDSSIKLERKKKCGSYINKESAVISREDFERILRFDFLFLLRHREPLCREFYYECVSRVLRPKVIVDYVREPWILREGDVRITFDRDVCAAVGSWDIFDSALPAISVLESGKLVLEVKFTGFLPGGVRRLLPLSGQEFTALSKYAACFERVWHLTDPTFGAMKSF